VVKAALDLFIDGRQIIFCVPGDVKIDLGIDALGHGFLLNEKGR